MEKAVTAKQVAKLASYGGMSPRAIRANAPDNRLHALRAWTTGQKTPIATTIATMTTDAVIAKGLTAEKIRGLTPITPVSDGAFLRAWASALEALAEGKTPQAAAGGREWLNKTAMSSSCGRPGHRHSPRTTVAVASVAKLPSSIGTIGTGSAIIRRA